MMNAVKKIFMNKHFSKTLDTGALSSVFNLLEKSVNKVYIKGMSPNHLISIKMNPMMTIKEVKIHPEALIDPANTPPETVNYIRLFCDILEKEMEMVCQNTQNRLINKAKIASEEIDKEEENES